MFICTIQKCYFVLLCYSDQNAGNTAENKKKKERRKDKDTMETSDDEVTEVQGKNNYHLFLNL